MTPLSSPPPFFPIAPAPPRARPPRPFIPPAPTPWTGGTLLFNEREQLRTAPRLQQLLAHYAEAGAVDREVWQDRVMALDGVAPRDLSRLHGELIAYGWVEQNTGATPVLKAGVA